MKKFFKKIANAVKSAVETVIGAVNRFFSRKVTRTRAALASAVGEGYVDTGVKIIIAVVVGGVLLAGRGQVGCDRSHTAGNGDAAGQSGAGGTACLL